MPKVLVGPEEDFFYLRLHDSNDKEVAVLRSKEFQPLSALKNSMVSGVFAKMHYRRME